MPSTITDCSRAGASVEETGYGPALDESVREVFATMVGTMLHSGQQPSALSLPNLTAIVGLAGTFKGVVSIRCALPAAGRIAARMLGLAPDTGAGNFDPSLEESAADAIGEICNMVAGTFKAKIFAGLPSQDLCLLSVPSIIVGSDYHLKLLDVRDKTDIHYLFEQQPFWVSFERRQ